ncbi:L-seryl-tRNA(Sec) selenium transferase [Proteocatella sphenisci]|uniref:L-seryl-tRNA(Sec) selenium transferase n=1 Tax=Proteocatella sphenisci TaxID=181070 RepID=UPI0004BADE36|nr:L-seryl-tRNA(Sec) selenium transferase [Proteocatella sphenisci]
MKKHLLRELPSVDVISRNSEIESLSQNIDQEYLTQIIREETANIRALILKGEYPHDDINVGEIIDNIKNRLTSDFDFGLKKVINATGVVLHTNLGRAPMSLAIKEKFENILYGYCNLEYDIEKGARGSRHDHLKELILKLTGAEDVIVVNNNAAAVMLVLSTMCSGKEVIVSRGELVEIGGSFRIPKVMEHSGAFLKEVGSTNKTHLNDYAEEINENTAALMKVHTSNFKMMGFTESVSIKDLKPLADSHNIPIIDDLGSGVFIDLRKYGLEYEPTILDSLAQGSDVVTFSGDKLLGGPQCGVIVGKAKYIAMMKKNNLLRALRVDKMTISALAMTLSLYLDKENLEKNVPVLTMLSQEQCQLKEKAQRLLEMTDLKNAKADVRVETSKSQVGGGSLPAQYMDSYSIAVSPGAISVNELEQKMRLTEPHIVGRISNETYYLDVRTIFEEELSIVSTKLSEILK